MGKRKERRLAAKSNAGRRVKLDLFAEPSGDLGGSTVHDQVGADIESKHGAGLPNSPTSSGPRPENPLLLLGQYSDDEIEDDVNEKLDNGGVQNSLLGNKDEDEVLHGEGCLDLDVNAGEVNQHETDKDTDSFDINQNVEGIDKKESDATASTDLSKDFETGQVSAPGTSDLQQSGDVISGWQIVMHEESNQYYYWNTETGETSWEIPEVLARASELAGNHKTPAVIERTQNAFVDTQEPNLSSVATLDNLSATTLVEGSHSVELNGLKHESRDDTTLGNDIINSGSFNATLGDGISTRVGSDKFVCDMIGSEDHESGIDLSSSLVKHSESLLERLNSVKGSKDQLESLDCISKYIMEVEIRLSDIKSLVSFGSSLHQFWAHSERQLKRLEDSINDEICKIVKSAETDDKCQESMEHESEDDGTRNRVFFTSSENSLVSPIVNTAAVIPRDPDAKVPAQNAIPTEHLENSSEQVNGIACPDEVMSKNGLHAADDVDMDVDMEVEDASAAGNTAIADALGAEFAAPKQSIEPIQPAGYTSTASDDTFTVPPPPDEEWIPPPPPDNEQIPPPPPDEPPEPVYPPPPSYPETGPPTYAEQYNLSYTNSNFQYYGHAATEIPNTNFYGHVEGCQIAVPHAPVYYDAVPTTYTETPQITANPITPVAYYELQDGTVPPAPGVSSADSSQFHLEPAPISYEIRSVHSVEAGCNSLPTANDNSSAVGGETDRASIEVPSTTATIQAPAVASAKESVPLPSINAVSATATSAITKVQSKVPRSKKRTVAVAPSLRSNKKVSSLVNKWKAAKEELLEDEEEPENAYEMLERKRQREIEEWKAQQIASGEAKDNANFQPLGGDWRERVKRRRAQQATEAAQTSPELRSDENQQPDLTELSRDLPSGWQAYWDESSKQVYYGNVVTSETTWTRPTN